MEYRQVPPEQAAPPPELRLGPELEYPPPPPEFGQGSGGAEERPPRKRRLQRFFALPAILLTAFLCLRGVKPLPEPARPVAPTEAAPTQTLPAEPDTEPSTPPEGSVVIDLLYAVRSEDEVLYSYSVYSPTPSLDADPAQQSAYHGTPWPVSVYAQVSDGAGGTAQPESDPDVWESSRSLFEYSLQAEGLESPLTLTLTAVYTEAGEERSSVWTGPVAELPSPPQMRAVLERLPEGNIDFTAEFLPDPQDGYEYDLQVLNMSQQIYEGEEPRRLPLGEAPDQLPLEAGTEGYTLRYTGGSALPDLPEGQELSVSLELKDRNTGYIYRMESNRIPTGPDPIPSYPLGQGQIVLTVYNDTFDFEVPTAVPNDAYATILVQRVIDEAEFRDQTLPEPVTPSGYRFTGWVVDYGNPFDNGYERDDLYADGEPDWRELYPPENFCFNVEDVLTREDVERIPPSEDGNRYVNVHATWAAREPEEDELRLLLDDGRGNVTPVSIRHPMMSEGTLYLCRLPEPEWEGRSFLGWYDEEGEPVRMLNAWYSFTHSVTNADGSFGGYTGEPMSYTLYAHWR